MRTIIRVNNTLIHKRALTTYTVIQTMIGNLDRNRVDKSWRIAPIFSKVRVDAHKKGLWVTVRKETTGPVPAGWPILKLYPKNPWRYDKEIANKITSYCPEFLVLDFRHCSSFVPLDRTLVIIKKQGIEPLLITFDLSLSYVRQEWGSQKQSYPISMHLSRVDAPGPQINIAKSAGEDDRVAYAYLLGQIDACASKRASLIIDYTKEYWSCSERRWVLTGSERSANLIADVLNNGSIIGRTGEKRRAIPEYQPFQSKATVRILNSKKDIAWFTNNYQPSHLIVSMDKLGQDLELLDDFLAILKSKRMFSFLITPPTDILGVSVWKEIRSRLFMCIRIGWNLEDTLFFRWRRGAKMVEGAAQLVETIRKVRHVKNTIQPNSQCVPTPRVGTA